MKKINLLFAILTVYFSVFSQAPTITSFSPASGPVGTLVTITGTNLSSPTAFTIGGIAAIAVSNTGTTLVGMIMPGAATGSISVITAGGSIMASGNFTISPTPYPNAQQGSKLVGTGAIVLPNYNVVYQGYSVAMSADGNTAIVGGYDDASVGGAVWIYTRTGGIWSQQGPKLLGSGTIGDGITLPNQGWSVALSADGNTAIVGGPGDQDQIGAAWVFTRSDTTWTQQGNKLIGTGFLGKSGQGYSVSISADGNTAIVGGQYDNTGIGAAWIYTRSDTTWTQQGSKLVGSGAINGSSSSRQGSSVSISADGNTAIVGGSLDNSDTGAVWIYTRIDTTWTQQGPKLVGTGGVGTFIEQGQAVALSADGNTAIVGGQVDNNHTGAVWVFTRTGGIWSQQGPKLVGTGAIYGAIGEEQGNSVALSADGNTAIVGGFNDSNSTGAVWIYIRSDTTWIQQGSKVVGSGAVGFGGASQGQSVALSADGTTMIEGGSGDNEGIGAAWIFISVDTTTGIEDLNGVSAIHLYPNPNKGSFTLQTSASIGSDYTISDMLGHIIMQQPIRSDTETVEMRDAVEGVYTLAVKGAQPIRFVVMK